MSDLGTKLKRAREKAGFTQAQLGKMIGVSGVAIMRYEKGLRQPRYEKLKKMADALQCDMSDLLDEKDYAEVTIDYFKRKFNQGGFTDEDEDAIMDAIAEDEAPGTTVERYLQFVSAHPILMGMIEAIGVELKIRNWRMIEIIYGECRTEARIGDFVDHLKALWESFADTIRYMFTEDYGIKFDQKEELGDSTGSNDLKKNKGR